MSSQVVSPATPAAVGPFSAAVGHHVKPSAAPQLVLGAHQWRLLFAEWPFVSPCTIKQGTPLHLKQCSLSEQRTMDVGPLSKINATIKCSTQLWLLLVTR